MQTSIDTSSVARWPHRESLRRLARLRMPAWMLFPMVFLVVPRLAVVTSLSPDYSVASRALRVMWMAGLALGLVFMPKFILTAKKMGRVRMVRAGIQLAIQVAMLCLVATGRLTIAVWLWPLGDALLLFDRPNWRSTLTPLVDVAFASAVVLGTVGLAAAALAMRVIVVYVPTKGFWGALKEKQGQSAYVLQSSQLCEIGGG